MGDSETLGELAQRAYDAYESDDRPGAMQAAAEAVAQRVLRHDMNPSSIYARSLKDTLREIDEMCVQGADLADIRTKVIQAL